MINTREIATEYRLTHWAGIMRERSASGMSIKAYCESIGIRTNVYFYWQKKLREATCEQMSTIVQAKEETAVIPSGWAVCETAKDEVLEKPITIEVGKFRIVATTEIDSEHLSKVCRTLLNLC